MRDTLIAAYLDYRNNYLSVQAWADHNGLTWAEGEQLLILARRVFSVHTIDADDGAAGPAVCMLMTPSGAIDNHEANARLIAAAPELLEALSSLASQHSESDLRADPDLHAAVKRARAAIAKATGAQA